MVRGQPTAYLEPRRAVARSLRERGIELPRILVKSSASGIRRAVLGHSHGECFVRVARERWDHDLSAGLDIPQLGGCSERVNRDSVPSITSRVDGKG